ncbi:MAG: hypothetical protein ACPG5B_15485 [Chitinophagales bacterium]
MKKKIMMCFLLLVLLSVAVGCAVKPYSKVIEIPQPHNFPYAIVGSSSDGNGFFIATMGYNNAGTTRLIAKCNEKGKIEWAKSFEHLKFETFEATPTADNGLIIVGYPIKHTSVVLLKIDRQGNLAWAKDIQINRPVTY